MILCYVYSLSRQYDGYLGGREVQKDPFSAKKASTVRWDPGGLQEHTVVAGQGGRGFGEPGCGLLGGHQDLRATKGLVRGYESPRSLGFSSSTAFLGLTHAQLLQQAMVFWLSIQQFQQIGRLHPLKLYLPVHIDLLVERDIHKAGAVAALFAGIQAWEVWVERQRSISFSSRVGRAENKH